MFTPPAPTSFKVFTNFDLSSGLKDSYILREIIVIMIGSGPSSTKMTKCIFI